MTAISGPKNESPRRLDQELAQPFAGHLVGHAAAGGRSLSTGGLAPCSEPGKVLAPGKGAPSEAVRVQQRGTSIRLACGCGHFVLSFRSLGVVRHGRFRCPICGRQVRLSRLEALLEICRITNGEETRASMSELASSQGSGGLLGPD